MNRRAFFVSDRTGITAETLGASLITQFPDIEFKRTNIPFITNELAAHAAVATIQRAAEEDQLAPLVFSTLTDLVVQQIVATSSPHFFDLFGTFIAPLESALGCQSSHTAGRMHGVFDAGAYDKRMQALNFTLSHDDGLSPRDLKEADLVLLGVSRSGKTPTCLYLAMHYSLKTANYPLTDDDFGSIKLPKILQPCRDKLYGLTIAPEQLSRIRRERRATGDYSSLVRCRAEIAMADAMFRTENIQYIDTTTVSIEEIAATVVRDMGLH